MYKRVPQKKDGDEKKRKEEREKEAAKAFAEFVEAFDDKPVAQGKVWVKAGTFNAGTREESGQEKGKLYMPKSRFEPQQDKRPSSPEQSRSKADKNATRKKEAKKKSNLEVFKDELKRIQEEREERHRLKSEIASGGCILPIEDAAASEARQILRGISRFETPPIALTASPLSLEANANGSFDTGDPTTTNLYLGNLAPKLSEQRLMEIFGKFGPLASVKIMWPRNDDERSRGRNCGFVAYMNRRDAEAAMEDLGGKDVESFEMKMGWGKPVPIPPHPIYLPPSMVDIDKPPPASGLPFNAQPRQHHKEQLPVTEGLPEDPQAMAKFNKMLQKAVVKVVVPTERQQLMVIHRMLEFVIREGPMFEAIIMNREVESPMYRFLFNNSSPEHIYYRWKLFSMMHGDSATRWRTDKFRMFKGGSIWQPPSMNPYMISRNVPRRPQPDAEAKRKKSLSDSQRTRFETQLRHLTPERKSVAETMVWCLDHADSCDEICACITESLSNTNTQLPVTIARLYLICDILHNCSARVSCASKYRTGIQEKLPQIFEQLHATFSSIASRLRAEAFKQRVMQVFRAWEDSAIYSQEFLIGLQNTFLGLSKQDLEEAAAAEAAAAEAAIAAAAAAARVPTASAGGGSDSDVDGAPLSDSDDVDGVPLDGAALLKKALRSQRAPTDDDDDDDVDGVPLEEGAVAIIPSFSAAPAAELREPVRPVAGFVPSRWETVDPDDVAAGVVTTSKWEELAVPPASAAAADGSPLVQTPTAVTVEDDDDDVDGVPLEEPAGGEESRSRNTSAPQSPDGLVSEERRLKLREVEVKVMSYQDDLESGQRSVKTGYTLTEQVKHYRSKLLKKAERQLSEVGRKRRRDHRDRSSSSDDPDESAAAGGSGRHRSGASSSLRRPSRSPDSDRAKRSRRRSRSHSSSRRRRRSRSPPAGYRRSRSPRSRSRSPARSKSSRRKSRR